MFNSLNSFYLSVLFSGAGFIATIMRDISLNEKIDNPIFFVTYISLCAFITTPLSERMQYGFKSNENLLSYSVFIFSIALILNLFFFISEAFDKLMFVIGLSQNIIICLTISILLGSLANNKKPHMIRLVAPFFPSLNILLVFIFMLQNSFIIVNISYLILFFFVILFYSIRKITVPLKKPSANKSDLCLFRGIFWHYLSFSFAYLSVIFNANILNFDHLMVMRLPIYFYLIFSLLLPYIKVSYQLNVLVNLLITIFSFFIFLTYDFINEFELVILIIEILFIFFISKIAKFRSVT